MAEAGKPLKGPLALIASVTGFIANIATTILTSIFNVLLWVANVILIFIILFLKTIGRIFHIITLYVMNVVGGFIPAGTNKNIDQMLIYAGVDMVPQEVIGLTLVYSVIVSVISYLVTSIVGVSMLVLVTVVLVSFVGVWAFPFVLLNLLAVRRTESVEEVLPDVLDMIAQNMMAGMTSYNALWAAARPEFGPLAIEIQDVARSTLTGTPLSDALVAMTNKIKSVKLERSIRLMIQGMKSGGELPSVLKGISTDMRTEQNLAKQMRAETHAHALFILVAILIGAPMLFAVSIQFIKTFSTLFEKLNISDSQVPQAGIVSLKGLSISPDFFFMYALLIFVVLGFFGALLISLIRTGKPVAGVPNIPVLVLGSIIVFLVLNHVLGVFFGGFFV